MIKVPKPDRGVQNILMTVNIIFYKVHIELLISLSGNFE